MRNFGRSVLSDRAASQSGSCTLTTGLNAPFGARCFLTTRSKRIRWVRLGLNAPFGVRCFLA